MVRACTYPPSSARNEIPVHADPLAMPVSNKAKAIKIFFHNHFESIYDIKNKTSDILVLFYATKAIKAVKQCSDTDCHTNKQEWKTKGVTSSEFDYI